VIVGDAHHVSTSKTIATIWTYAVASALLSLVIARWIGHSQGFDNQASLQPGRRGTGVSAQRVRGRSARSRWPP
jgi:hypothetical protein